MKLFNKKIEQLKVDHRCYRCWCGIELEGRRNMVDHMNSTHTAAEILRETGRVFLF